MSFSTDSRPDFPAQPVDEETPLLTNTTTTTTTTTYTTATTSNTNTNAAAAAATRTTGLEAQASQTQRDGDDPNVLVAEELTTKQLLSIMGSLYVSTFFVALDHTVVATLSGPISSSFKSGTAFSWIASGYLIANAACQPLSGKLTDIYGRRAGLVFAVVFFSIGTLICGLAPNVGTMIFGRIIAGAGGGCLNTTSVFIASDLIPLRKRGLWQGIGNIVFGAGMGLGGVYGGFINDIFSWRYAFILQLPFIVIGGIIAISMVQIPVEEGENKLKRVDFLGAFTLVASLVFLLLGLNSGGNVVPWKHPLVSVSIPLSLVFLLLFVFIEDRVASEPMIVVRLLGKQSVAAACLTNWFMTMGTFALIYYGPVFFQVVREVSATQAGTMFIPQSIGSALGSLGAGVYMRWTGHYWWLNLSMQTLSVSSAALILVFFDEHVPLIPPSIFVLMGGMAYGSMLTITLIALISAVDHQYQAVITSASYAFRSTGSLIGITIASAVFQNLLQSLLWERFQDFPNAASEIKRIRDSPDAVRDLPASWKEGVILAYVGALKGVWVTVLGFAGLAAIASLFIKQHTLYNRLDRK